MRYFLGNVPGGQSLGAQVNASPKVNVDELTCGKIISSHFIALSGNSQAGDFWAFAIKNRASNKRIAEYRIDDFQIDAEEIAEVAIDEITPQKPHVANCREHELAISKGAIRVCGLAPTTT